jgi:hypothetical protein
MKRKKIFPIVKKELESFSTKRLLARLKSLHQCEQSFDLSDRDESERLLKFDYIEFKESSEWQSEFEKVKEILSKREHIS